VVDTNIPAAGMLAVEMLDFANVLKEDANHARMMGEIEGENSRSWLEDMKKPEGIEDTVILLSPTISTGASGSKNRWLPVGRR
jgi:hypothetical protein